MTQTPTHDGSTTLGLIVDSTPVTAPSVPPPVVPVTVPVTVNSVKKPLVAH